MRLGPDNANVEYMARTSSEVGSRIETRRERHGLTQAQLAKAANLHQSQVSRFERGDRIPSIEQATALASALGCSVGVLIGSSRRTAA